MKIVKKLFFFLLLLFTMSNFQGRDIVSYLNQSKTENPTPDSDIQNGFSIEIAVEEEIAVCQITDVKPVQFTKENITPLFYSFPDKIYLSIWFPPDIF